jgi:hypothetical protein
MSVVERHTEPPITGRLSAFLGSACPEWLGKLTGVGRTGAANTANLAVRRRVDANTAGSFSLDPQTLR